MKQDITYICLKFIFIDFSSIYFYPIFSVFTLFFRDFEKQRQIMISLLDAFKESMDSEASQACVSFFTKYFAGRSLTTDYSYMLNYIKSYTYEGGGTYTHKAFDMDYEEFSESNARVKDKAVRTIIFVLTDGQSGRPDLLPQSVKKVVVFCFV